MAELTNKSFRDFLKEQNLFTRIIQALVKIFGYTKKAGDEISTNAYKEAQEVLYKIMDNHKDNFTRDFDDYYKRLDFLDLDNYKNYLKKHSERVKNYKDSIYLDILASAGVKSKNVFNYGYDVYKKTLGVNHYDELEKTPLTQILKDIIEEEKISVKGAARGLNLEDKNTQKFLENLTILKGLSPFFTSGLYKKVDEKYARYLLENLKNIGNRRITYKGKIFNTFFAKEFADREIEKLTKGDLYSLGIIPPQNATKRQGMQTLSKFIKDNELDYSQMGEISALPAMQKYKDFMDSFLSSKNIKKLSQNKIAMQTPAGEVKIYLPYAYGHFHRNGKFGNKKEKRNNLTGALKEILTNPLFVTKDKRGSLYFYKPFRDKDNILDLISVSVDKEGKIQYKTTYTDKYKQVLSLIKNNELVYIRS